MTAAPSLTLALFLAAQLPLVESADFSKDLQATALTATVRVTHPTTKFTGSGVIVRQDGAFVHLLTAGHIVGDAEHVTVDVFSAKSFPKPARTYQRVEVLARAKNPDLALLRLVTRDPMPGVLPICPADKLPPAREMRVLTCGLGEQALELWTDTAAGPKLVRKPTGETATLWELRRAATPGRSGGPLLDQRGYLLGIGSGRADGKGYAVAIEEIHRFLKQHKAQRLYETPRE